MAHPNPQVAQLASRTAAHTRFHGPEAPQTLEARRELAAAQIEDYIVRTVAAAPPLSAEQAWRLTALLRPADHSVVEAS